ncbi:PREDICTED: stearoyl-CoA desaturase 5-like [Nicrophorus vespilloides]|uniref:Stearoyl-CoA desaturase 5-like n=1 Tax=Nicrophorus vespilloides TaxID=110193 RepID=A0ABM1NGD8_NICVS|nr:PREDICTED: stearoyl-CoA desaturase 5-like [Nicrophorus vespilloides]
MRQIVDSALNRWKDDEVLEEVNKQTIEKIIPSEEDVEVKEVKKTYVWNVVWTNVLLIGGLHLGAIYGLYIRSSVPLVGLVFNRILGFVSIFGVTAGAHRLWCHKSYKANTFVQLLLLFANSLTYQNSVYTWSRDHRLHHKHSETDADPHNAKRGFFFSHVGWLLVRKHEEVIEKGKTIDMSDLQANPYVMFQHKYYYPIVFMFTLVIPTFIPWYFFNISFLNCLFSMTIYRYIMTLNLTWCINSFAHMHGNKPYDASIGPTENTFMKYLGTGEGFHNYHHTFPWDYKASELQMDFQNMTTLLIDFFAKCGWVTDRKTVEKPMIVQRASRTGDGTYKKRFGLKFLEQAKNLTVYLLFWMVV